MSRMMAVRVPVALKDAANHTHVLLGLATSPTTYGDTPRFECDGVPVHGSLGEWSDRQLAGMLNPAIIGVLERAGQVPPGVGLDLVRQAQAAFALIERAEDESWPEAPADKIVGMKCDTATDAFEALCVRRIVR